MKTTTIIISIFLAFSSFGLQAQRNSIVGVWHFPETAEFIEFTETHVIFDDDDVKDDYMMYRIVGNRIKIFDCEYDTPHILYYYFKLTRNLLELRAPDYAGGYVLIGTRVNPRRNRTVIMGEYLPFEACFGLLYFSAHVKIVNERWAQLRFDSGEVRMMRYRVIGYRLYLDGGFYIFEINRNGTIRLIWLNPYELERRNIWR